jgi:ADP-ribose pyrophosphatase
MTDKKVEILEKVTCHAGFFTLNRYKLKHTLFAGGWTADLLREVLERGHAVAVLPYDPITDKVVLIEQFRPGAMVAEHNPPWLFEIVAGIIEPNELPEQVAHREMQEEAGCKILDLKPIYHFFVSPGAVSETTQLYCAKVDASNISGLHGVEAEAEDIKVHVMPYQQAMQMLNEGKIMYAPAIMALQWLTLHREQLRQDWGC